MKCPKCGAEIKDNWNFCPKCNQSLKKIKYTNEKPKYVSTLSEKITISIILLSILIPSCLLFDRHICENYLTIVLIFYLIPLLLIIYSVIKYPQNTIVQILVSIVIALAIIIVLFLILAVINDIIIDAVFGEFFEEMSKCG